MRECVERDLLYCYDPPHVIQSLIDPAEGPVSYFIAQQKTKLKAVSEVFEAGNMVTF